MTLCPFGSTTLPGAPVRYRVTDADLATFLGTAYAKLSPGFWSYWFGKEYTLPTFCATEPAAVPTISDADVDLLANPIGFFLVRDKFDKFIDAAVWSKWCGCVGAPGGCTVYPLDPAPLTNVTFAGNWPANYSAGYRFTPLVSGTFTSVAFNRTGSGAQPTIFAYIYRVDTGAVVCTATLPATSTVGLQSDATSGPVVAGVTYMIVVNAGALWAELDRVSPVSGDTSKVTLGSGYYKPDTAAGVFSTNPNTVNLPQVHPVITYDCGTSTVPAPTAPPLPDTPTYPTPTGCTLDDLCKLLTGVRDTQKWTLDLVTLIQRQAVPFAYIPDVSWTASGNGEHAVSDIVALAVDCTDHPNGSKRFGHPDSRRDNGYINLGTADGWSERIDLRHKPQLIMPIVGAITRVGYSLVPGTTASFQAFRREF